MANKETGAKTLGQAIDAIIHALEPLEEASRITAIRASCEHLNIPLEEKPRSAPSAEGSSTPKVPTITPSTDIKRLKEEKKPSSAIEMAALVAYYLSEIAPEPERKPAVKVADMVNYFNQARYTLPKSPGDLLSNAKKAGYFDSLGSGRYKLNPVGYNLVAYNLPRLQSQIATKPVRTRKPHKAKRSRPSRKS